MKRYKMEIKDTPWGLDGFMVRSNKGKYVDADIAQELYDHLKHVVDKASDFIDNEVLNGSDDDFDQWFMSACKTLEKADKD